MILLPEDAIILKRLFAEQSKEIDVYVFHEANALSPGQLARSLDKLLASKIIMFDGKIVKLTKEGFNWILTNKNSFYRVNKKWKEIPWEMRIVPLQEDQVFLPESINTIKFNLKR